MAVSCVQAIGMDKKKRNLFCLFVSRITFDKFDQRWVSALAKGDNILGGSGSGSRTFLKDSSPLRGRVFSLGRILRSLSDHVWIVNDL